jgi:hypothetical protein
VPNGPNTTPTMKRMARRFRTPRVPDMLRSSISGECTALTLPVRRGTKGFHWPIVVARTRRQRSEYHGG